MFYPNPHDCLWFLSKCLPNVPIVDGFFPNPQYIPLQGVDHPRPVAVEFVSASVRKPFFVTSVISFAFELGGLGGLGGVRNLQGAMVQIPQFPKWSEYVQMVVSVSPGDPQVTMAFNTKMVIHDLDDLGLPTNLPKDTGLLHIVTC